MEPLDAEYDFDYDGPVVDDPMLVDFHLGNALNLDIVSHLVLNDNPGYNLHVPRFMIHAWRELQNMLPIGYSYQVGFLEITTYSMVYMADDMQRLTPRVWNNLANIVIRSLKHRGLNIPITTTDVDLNNMIVHVPTSWILPFNLILGCISSISEILRGGERAPYENCRRSGNYIVSQLFPNREQRIYVGRNMSAIVDVRLKTVYVGNFDSVLLLMDTLGQRICAIVGNHFAEKYVVNGCMPQDILSSIIRTGDTILLYGGNLGYEVISLFESIVVSVLLKKNPDDISDTNEFYENCLGEIEESVDGLQNIDEITICIKQWIKDITNLSSSQLSNVFSIYRIWGHPRVNILQGMKKVYDKATATKKSIHVSESYVLYQFRQNFLQNYLSKHKRYPSIEVKGDGYVQERLRGGLPIDYKDPKFHISDYKHVTIGQIWTVPETYDICHILNDKAVSPTQSELFESVRAGKGTIYGTLRRGIIRWMEGESIRCREFLEEIDKHGLPKDDCIIGMYEKEREIKVKARMFSLMSEKMRMYIVLTEELIANHILPYFPEITMKDPLNVQIRKIWKVGGSGQSPYNPNINIDFEKWNLNMRPEFTNGLFHQMDLMFGFNNLITRTHEIFSDSYIYSCSGKYNPIATSGGLVVDPPMAYMGHKGGFEGLRQKGWTVATVCLLAYTAGQVKVDMQLLGQGDNQVIKLFMPLKKWDNLNYTHEAKVEESKRLTGEYIKRMRENFHDAGLPIKVRETWISTRLFMYGKAMYLDGDQKPQWMKKLLRSYALSNEGSVTISGVIGTIATNMTSAAGASDAPDVMYIIFLFLAEWSLEYLLHYHPFTRKSIRQGNRYDFYIPGYRGKIVTQPVSIDHLITTLLMVPTAIGGSVTIPLTGFIMRGFPDHASEGYAWMNLLRSVPSNMKGLFDNWYSFIKNKSIQHDMLVQSPWSLNHLKPPTPGLQSRDMVRNWLLSNRFPKNRFLRNMSEINNTFARKEICKELMSDPINPLVTYEVFNAFPQAYYDQILRRFEGTRSVRKLAMKEAYSEPIVSKLMNMEERHIYYLIWRGGMSGEVYSTCATQQARTARDIGWERSIHGLTTPHPIEFLFNKVCLGYNPMCDGSDYILTRFSNIGTYPPYLGSKVKTKVLSLQDEVARSEPLICSNARLARYLKWLDMGENLRGVVKACTDALCDTDVFDNFYDLTPGAEGYTGCVEHRFNPAAASDGCFINYAPQLGSHVYLSGDYMPKFGKGKENYTIHFQAIYCFLQYISARDSTRVSAHFHLCCDGCIVPCNDEIADISPEHHNIDRAFSPQTLSLLRETLGFIRERPMAPSHQHQDYLGYQNEVPFDPKTLDTDHCYTGVVYLLAVKCTMALFSRGTDSDTMEVEDLQSFPRVYSYKIVVEHIITAVCNVAMGIFLMRSQDEVNTITWYRAKRDLIKQLDRTPLSKFKHVASICVGRVSTGQRLRYMLPTGCFPDDTQAFVRGVKNCVLDTLTELGDFTIQSYNIVIPKLSTTEKEYRTLLGVFGLARFRCKPCGETIFQDVPLSELPCRNSHILNLLAKMPLVSISLDRLTKMLTIKSKLRYHKNIVIPRCGVLCLPVGDQYALMDHHNYNQEKQFRRINLPTSNIYKWVSIISNIPSQNYQSVIVLGDGTGGTSYIASHHFQDSIIYPMAKFEKQKMIPQDSESIHPFLSRGYPNVKYDLIESLPDDMMSNIWVTEMLRFLQASEGPFLIISDTDDADSTKILEKLSVFLNLINVDIVVRIYKTDLNSASLQGYQSVLWTPHCNSELGEVILTNTYYESNFDITVKLTDEQSEIEEIFRDAVSLSWTLSRYKISSLGITMGRKLMLGTPDFLMATLMSYINLRYKFPQDRINARDVRNIHDGMLLKLIRIIKIMVLSFAPESIAFEDWFKKLCLVRVRDQDRKSALTRRRISLLPSQTVTNMISVDDALVARTIRGCRPQIYSLDGFQGLAQILMIDRPELRNADLRDLIMETESIDNMSDLAYE
uniref:Replicase n=1 Tax=Lupinus virus 1 TaxID=2977974 RepID=A0A9N7AB36_9RHAB|nr:TPA_asm: polyprotein [Lupinus virus 1]